MYWLIKVCIKMIKEHIIQLCVDQHNTIQTAKFAIDLIKKVSNNNPNEAQKVKIQFFEQKIAICENEILKLTGEKLN